MAYNVARLKGKEHFENGKWWVSPINYLPDIVKDFRGKKVQIHDATLRDGEQTVALARMLVNSMPSAAIRSMAGVRASEAWQAETSPYP